MADPVRVDVAVIGAGPAGIGAGLALRRRGAGTVLILDREPEAGGVPRHCGHPPFGLREFGRILTGPAYARKLVERALAAGIGIRPRSTVVSLGPGGDLTIVTPDGPGRIEARRVVIATGARETPRSARLVGGDRPLGVINTGALQSLVYLKHLLPFSKPVIVGTELVGLSAVLTCLRAGARPAAVVEENPGPTARWPLTLFPRLVGVPVHYGARLAEIRGAPRVEGVGVDLAAGGRHEVACDGVVFTGRFVPEAALVRASHLAFDGAAGGPSIDQYGRCSDPAYFAAGNVLRPVETAGWSFREGSRIGELVADDLAGRLAAPGHQVPITSADGLRMVVPQRLDLPLTRMGIGPLQLRAARPVSGRLVLRADGVAVGGRPVDTVPERRILLPLAGLSIPSGTSTLQVAVEPG